MTAKQKFLSTMYDVLENDYSSNDISDYWRPQLEAIKPEGERERCAWVMLRLSMQAECHLGWNAEWACQVAKVLCASRARPWWAA